MDAEYHCRPGRVASLRIYFPSTFSNRARQFRTAAGRGMIPLQRFDAPAVLGATPLRRPLTSWAPATVDRGFDHAPPASFTVAFRYRPRMASAWSKLASFFRRTDPPAATTLLGFL